MEMRSRWFTVLNMSLIVALLTMTFVYIGESHNANATDDPLVPDIVDEWADDGSQEEIVLKIWSHKDFIGNEITHFLADNPHVRVEFTSFQNETRIVERYLNALADGTAPDILALSQAMLGSFNSVDLIADLQQSHLNLDQYRARMGEYLWDIHQSLDGESTIALPFEAYPYALFYREDILRANGYPHEPEELATYIKQPERWVKLVEDFHEKGMKVFQWETDLLNLINSGQFFFNRDIEYQRSSDHHRQVADVSLQVKDYAANMTIWNPNGQELLRNEQMIMVMLPAFGSSVLSGWLPEQAGKWRMTNLPLGIESIDLNSSLSFAITAQSQHKATAAKLLGYLMDTSTVINWFQTEPLNPFLGYQDSGDLSLEILKGHTPNTVPTPLDARLFDMWFASTDESLGYDIPAEQSIEAAEQDIMDATSVAQEQLQLYLQGSPQ